MREFLSVNQLTVSVGDSQSGRNIVNQVSFSLSKGQVLALIGESGSGKTTIALSLMGYAKPGCTLSGGEIWLDQDNLLTTNTTQLRQWRGKRMAYIAQSAAASFNPSKKLIDQVIEPALLHKMGSKSELTKKAVTLFQELALPEPETIGSRFPHQVSGGQLQRVMAAMALIVEPELVILDEPTTALDVTTQVEVLQVFRRVVQERNVTAVYVSHDLAVVAQVADHVVVLQNGTIKEQGAIQQILHTPENNYTQALLSAADPGFLSARQTSPEHQPSLVYPRPEPLLAIRKLLAGYGKRDKKGIPETAVLDDINLNLYKGQAIGIIGESGSGKSTLAKSLAGLLPPALGTMRFCGEDLSGKLNLRSKEQCRRIQLVFQSADTALNPKHTVESLLGRPLKAYFNLKGQARKKRILELLELVQLPAEIMYRKPAALSGGQKQRVNLARALAANPDIIICDEVTSALDTVVGSAILALLKGLKTKLGLSYIFISHDINSVKTLCDKVVVMYKGTQVQTARTSRLFLGGLHPYTALLMDSIPQMRTDWINEPRIAAESMTETPAIQPHREICAFLSRCPRRIANTCDRIAPSLRPHEAQGRILCHLAENQLPRVQDSDLSPSQNTSDTSVELTSASDFSSVSDTNSVSDTDPFSKNKQKESYA
jgi:peptide/nickel transport system ATP-binding protein